MVSQCIPPALFVMWRTPHILGKTDAKKVPPTEISIHDLKLFHVYMRDAEASDHLTGDVCIFNDNSLAALWAGLRFRKTSREALAVVPRERYHGNFETSSPRKFDSPRSNPSKPVKDEETKILPPQPPPAADPAPAHARKPFVQNASITIPAAKWDIKKTTDQLLGIIAAERGWDASDMDLSTSFTEIGVDSIMSIAITTAAKTQLQMDLPVSCLIDHPTVSDLGKAIAALNYHDNVTKSATSNATEPEMTKAENLAKSPASRSKTDVDSDCIDENLDTDGVPLESSLDSESMPPATTYSELLSRVIIL